ncbi:MAG: family transporter [Bacteroidota bacterium]|jgi:predicted PurR-regulated permease PerM|nr:family transporter [Bacteroidota bacterium]
MQAVPEKNTNKTIFMVVIVIFGILLLISLREYFTAFLGSLMFYVLFKKWMENLVKKRNWKKGRAAILIIVVSFFIILVPVSLFVTMLYNKVAPVVMHPTEFVGQLKQIDSTVQDKFNVKLLSEKNIQDIQARGTAMLSGVLNEGLGIFASITMMYFFLYFLLTNFRKTEATLLHSLPFSRQKIMMFGSELKAQTFSNAIGVPLIALTQGIFAFIIYLITGLPEAAFWAILTGFSSVIPIVGTGIIWVPAAIYMFVTGHTWQGIAIIGWCGLVMGSMDNVIRFMLAKKMADVHPVVTVLGIILGIKFLGITGLIFGPLIISYFLILLKIYNAEYQSSLHVVKKEDAVLELGVPFIYSKKFVQKRDPDNT